MWSISNIDNTVKLSKKQALELTKISKYMSIVGDYYEVLHMVWNKPDLEFIFSRFFKHFCQKIFIIRKDRDYVSQIADSLKQLKVKGDITFGSMDGDNSGQFWGYRFDGKGGMKSLVGSLSFTEQ